MSTSVETTQTAREKEKAAKPKRYPFWGPRFWHGMRLHHFFALLWRNRFRVHPLRWSMVFTITWCAVFNSLLYRFQQLIYGRKIAKTKIEHPPIFIIGHWRSGTTFMHELLVCDDHFAYPTTYECFTPFHFLVSSWYWPKVTAWMMPKQRPQDNMAMGYDRPQEDEFALVAMGAPTPYARMAFPNHPPPYLEFFNMEGVDQRDLRRFKNAMLYFVRALTLRKKKQLVMKSPPHTGRIKLLSEMFPGAKFIHMVRDPYALFPSTQRTWDSLDRAQGLQFRRDDVDEMILECFERMYDGFERQRNEIDPAAVCDVHYEDLARDPVGVVEMVYDKLNLGDFEAVREKLEKFVDRQRGYKTNRHELEPEIKEQIDRRWAGYIEKYGY